MVSLPVAKVTTRLRSVTLCEVSVILALHWKKCDYGKCFIVFMEDGLLWYDSMLRIRVR